MSEKVLKKLNIFGRCRRYGLSFWQCPQFLFLIMGVIIIITALFLYLVGLRYLVDPETVIFIVFSVTAILFTIAYVVTNGFERLAEISKMKSDFINIVSHQLRSPLTNIKWAFELLSSKGIEMSQEKKEEYFDNIKENIARMVELTDNLLVVSKIEQGKFSVLKKEVSLKKTTESLISRFKVFAEAAKIKLNLYLEKDLPEIFIDPSLIKLVIENLIDNAIHYTGGGGRVDIKIGRRGKEILFKIQDSGIGIPKNEQEHIFQKFFRAENALKKRTRGNGLGLYICKAIIEKFGGKIWFESEEDKGTTFYFTLPIK
jgi:signal transduction histidine kinase